MVIDNSDRLGALHAGNPVHVERHLVAREMVFLKPCPIIVLKLLPFFFAPILRTPMAQFGEHAGDVRDMIVASATPHNNLAVLRVIALHRVLREFVPQQFRSWRK